MSVLKQMGQRIPARHILVLVDACYGGYSLVRAQGPVAPDPRYLALLAQSRVIQVLTAGRKNQLVAEERGHGVFTRTLLDGLLGHADSNGDGTLTGQELAAWMHPRVAQASDNKQDMQFGNLDGEGQFFFVLPAGLHAPLSPTPPQTPAPPPAAIVGRDGAPMVLVPAGEFTMGSNDGDADEKPPHRVFLGAFYIDTYEVTNARFQRFVQATKYRTEAERNGHQVTWCTPNGAGSTLNGLEKHPVDRVTLDDAKAYCAWAVKRLPTDAEWEKAARGTDGRRYPWGETFDGKRLNFCDRTCKDGGDKAVNDGYEESAPVGSYEGGKSPYGAYDMAGNAREWVTDPPSGGLSVLRGGGGSDNARSVRAPHRDYTPADDDELTGFRCAKSS